MIKVNPPRLKLEVCGATCKLLL